MLEVSKGKYLLLIILSIMGGLIAPINALIWQRFLDRLITIEAGAAFGFNCIVYVIVLSAIPFLGYVINIILQNDKQTYSDQMNLFVVERVMGKAIKLPMEKFDETSFYNDMNIAISRTAQNCMSLLDSITEAIYYCAQIVSFTIIMLCFDWKIVALSIIGALPIFHVSIRTNKYWFTTLSRRIEKLRYIDYLKGLLIRNEYVKETRLYGTNNKILKYIKSGFETFIKEDKHARYKFAQKKTTAQFIDEIINFSAKIWILISSVKRKEAVGSIVLYLNSYESLKNSWIATLNEVSKMQDSILYLQVLKCLDELEIQYKQDKGIEISSIESIEFRNVSFSYPGQGNFVLKNLTATFERGKTYSLVGLNGAGKTTLLKLLLGIYEPTDGIILLNGIDLRKTNKESFYKMIGAVFQDFIKYPSTIEGNISTDLEQKNDEGIIWAVNKVGLGNVVKQSKNGLNTKLMKEWGGDVDLSQGQWQKIAVARCLYRKADIMIFDEPFSSIDIEAENQILKNIRGLGNNTINIFITHHFSSISLADEIMVLDDGEIIERGTHDDLIKKRGKYFNLYSEQFESLKNMCVC